ncbi:MAG: hypothetical protein AAGA27_06245 [Pseudomonadota bacterium]
MKDLIDENLATKSDIESIKLEIERFRAELKRDIAEMGLKVTIRFGGMLIAAVLVLAAIIKF